jgi:hypothetical protein
LYHILYCRKGLSYWIQNHSILYCWYFKIFYTFADCFDTATQGRLFKCIFTCESRHMFGRYHLADSSISEASWSKKWQGTTIQNSVTWATWCPRFVQPCQWAQLLFLYYDYSLFKVDTLPYFVATMRSVTKIFILLYIQCVQRFLSLSFMSYGGITI